MNHRIEKLSIEANSQTGNEFDLNHKPLDAFLAKFAELIVRECADVGERYADGNYEVARQILARFGMDEDEE